MVWEEIVRKSQKLNSVIAIHFIPLVLSGAVLPLRACAARWPVKLERAEDPHARCGRSRDTNPFPAMRYKTATTGVQEILRQRRKKVAGISQNGSADESPRRLELPTDALRTSRPSVRRLHSRPPGPAANTTLIDAMQFVLDQGTLTWHPGLQCLHTIERDSRGSSAIPPRRSLGSCQFRMAERGFP